MARLLVVDDESSIRLLYSQELADEGHEVATAATPPSNSASRRSRLSVVGLLSRE